MALRQRVRHKRWTSANGGRLGLGTGAYTISKCIYLFSVIAFTKMLRHEWVPPKEWIHGDDVFPFDEPWRGQMLYTGPGGLGDYRAHLLKDSRPLGTNQHSEESTYDTDYLWRAAPGTPFQKPRNHFAGEIGWDAFSVRDPAVAFTGHQILMSEFWRQVEDTQTHRFQTPWYWHPASGKPRPSVHEKPYGPFGYVRRHTIRTSSSSDSASPLTSRSVVSQGRLWSRAPDTTETTVYDLDYVGDDDGTENSACDTRAHCSRFHKKRLTAPHHATQVKFQNGNRAHRGELDSTATETDQSNKGPFTAPPEQDPSSDSIGSHHSTASGNRNCNTPYRPYTSSNGDSSGGINGRQSRAAHTRSPAKFDASQQRHLI